jgi:hypothetical protein
VGAETIIQLHKFENGRTIKYILLELNNLLNEIENLINTSAKREDIIKSIKSRKIKNLINLIENESENNEVNKPKDSSFNNVENSDNKIKKKETASATTITTTTAAPQQSAESNLNNLSVKNLRLKIQKINSCSQSPSLSAQTPLEQRNLKIAQNYNFETNIDPFLVENGMVKDNIIKIEKSINLILPTSRMDNVEAEVENSRGLHTNAEKGQRLKNNAIRDEQRLRLISNNITKFDAKEDVINENSNPVALLYFNDNSKKPIINQYLKAMSTYNMITNGTILYYSNIIGFNFKKKFRAYLPFFKAREIISSILNKEGHNQPLVMPKSGERITSPYSLRGIRKVVGSLDKGKFSVFGRGIENNKLINNIYKFLFLSFKSMYCLISKPVFIIKSNKIIIQLFYFLLIPKIFKHMKSKIEYKPKNHKQKYLNILVKRKKQELATLYQNRLKEKEDALKVKYFVTLMRDSELRSSNNNSTATPTATAPQQQTNTSNNQYNK